MPAEIRLPYGVAPTVSNPSQTLSSPTEVWLTWSLVNLGDADGDTSGIRWVLQDPNGSPAAGDAVASVSIAQGATIEQGVSIAAASFSSAGTYWANLVDPSGANLGGARIDVSA